MAAIDPVHPVEGRPAVYVMYDIAGANPETWDCFPVPQNRKLASAVRGNHLLQLRRGHGFVLRQLLLSRGLPVFDIRSANLVVELV